MGVWQRVQQILGLRPNIKSIQYSPNFVESAVQFGDRVRVLSDESTEASGFAGKIGEVYGQTTPSVTNPAVIGNPRKDYAVSVYFDDTDEQHWFAEHLLELVDHNPAATFSINGSNREFIRNSEGAWDEMPANHVTTHECRCCGELHDGLPMGYRLERPQVGADENSFEFLREGELCTVGNHHFILANIELPYREDDKFVWTCWISLSDESFERINARWESIGRENDEPAFGWLTNDLPTYEPSTLSLKTRVHQNPVGSRPWVELEPTDHPLALEQREGVNDERIAAVFHAFDEEK